ncbi:MAG: tRNA (guanosine(46)-N7)-methyltransferase TrmB [Rickettsiales bacterium]|nr:tRNA (guanosine(46)-N7)-methyltransferase TrmB [Rickettsiales bacterium]
MPILDNRKNIRSFGRVNGRGATKIDQNIFREKLSKYSVELGENMNFNEIFQNDCENHLEIGCGYGESIVARAVGNENANHVACEIYLKGVANLLNLIEQNDLKNIKIFNGDARLLLDNVADGSFAKVFLLFPDPWPKKRQNKKRIIGEEFLAMLARKMKAGGEFFFVSDIDDYVEWTLEKVEENGLFKKVSLSATPPSWWADTRYQQKAGEEGRAATFINFVNLRGQL